MSRIHDAVTAVLTVGTSVFILRRQPHLQAFPGYWAFPGGKVDGEEAGPDCSHPLLAPHPPQLMRALLRELREEIGLDLAEELAAGRVRSLAFLGEATTPAFAPLRFRTRFFRIALSAKPPLVLDAGEIAEAEWLAPAALCERYAAGRMLVVPPTRAVLEALICDIDADQVAGLAFDHEAQDSVPWMEPLKDLRLLLVRSHTLPPADRTNALLLGDRGAPRVLVDPSPAHMEELERLVHTLRDERIDLIFLTHHHPDHREFADVLARRWGVPLGMSADTRERIAARQPAFLADVTVRPYGEGDRLTDWLGQAVRVLAVPGHDAGQLALMPEDRAWCLVGDLIQGIGTVVVGGPEGSMRDYFASLQRIIDLDPAVIIPSHGAALGGTYRLRATLAHRRERETQIRSLYAAGRSTEDMVRTLYAGLDPRLLPLARINVDSHLAKLREDGAIA